MSVKVDWQIIDEDEAWSDEPPPVVKQKRQVPRWLMMALALIPVLAIAIAVAYIAWTYHAQLNQVAGPVQQVARMELQSVAINDQTSFMALQDPDNPTWRQAQKNAFGRLDRIGLPEFGWRSTNVAPQVGRVSLEPGGAVVNMAYQFTVTQPMPGGPVTVTLQVPEFFKPTPSGWVHAMPGPDFWGAERTQSGKRVTVFYYQRDADVVEPLISRMDDLVTRLCSPLACPSPITVVFENSLGFGGGFYGNRSATVRLPSPHLIALPTDTRSRDELYRALETRLVRTLVFQASGFGPNMNRRASLEIVQWELARMGLAGPLVTNDTRHSLANELRSGSSLPLEIIPLHSNSARLDTSSDTMLSLAFAFLEDTFGAGTVERLIPAMGTSATIGDAIRAALSVNPNTLDRTWREYLREQASLAGRQA
jgi:hypothetical protein